MTPEMEVVELRYEGQLLAESYGTDPGYGGDPEPGERPHAD